MALKPLPRIEMWIYLSVMVYVLYNAAIAIFNLSHHVSYGHSQPSQLGPGWSFIDRLKDSAGYEWDAWIGYIFKLWPWFLGHFLLGQIFCHIGFKTQVKQLIFLLVDAAALCYYFGHMVIIVIASQSLSVFILARLFRSKLLLWIVCLLFIYHLDSSLSNYVLTEICGIKQHSSLTNFIIFFAAWSILRYISYGIEVCQKNLSPSLLDLWCYVFYLPVAVTGSYIPCRDFVHQMKEPLVKPSLSFYLQLIFKSCRLTFWALLLELSAHFLYTQSLIYQHSLLEKCDDFTFCSYFIVLGISFHMKYLVMYGTGNTLARFDLLMPPPEPRCVVHVGSYTDMWRYFDVGIYRFIVEYIFIPLGGSKKGLILQLMSSLLSFAFVYIWHGLQLPILLWTLSSFLAVTLETVGRAIVRLPNVKNCLDQYIASQWQTRLYGIPTAALLVGGHVGVTLLLSNKAVGYMFVERVLITGWPWVFPASTAIMYCVVQVSLYIDKF